MTVAYATSNGTATAGADYTATSGTLHFRAGRDEPDDHGVDSRTTRFSRAANHFNVTLSAPLNAIIADDTGVGTILDDGTGGGGTDNDTPTLSVSNVSVTEGHGPARGLHGQPLECLDDAGERRASRWRTARRSAAARISGRSARAISQVSTDGGATWVDATTVTIAAGSHERAGAHADHGRCARRERGGLHADGDA